MLNAARLVLECVGENIRFECCLHSNFMDRKKEEKIRKRFFEREKKRSFCMHSNKAMVNVVMNTTYEDSCKI
jgi:hypothetical protein